MMLPEEDNLMDQEDLTTCLLGYVLHLLFIAEGRIVVAVHWCH